MWEKNVGKNVLDLFFACKQQQRGEVTLVKAGTSALQILPDWRIEDGCKLFSLQTLTLL